ncbi:MAG: hypothetical protein A2293_00280 [Elusimicrobia bacterium RIFOXYB2_FULL_49_7]|nr:MAG: hypothetical protein A2293_00280 [Elusimicrobia bacterium RIFOXYB2_FULL_49_7]
MKLSEGKIYHSISEVCSEVGLEPHVLRYWETEFPSLNPKKNRAGNRAYRKRDIELIKYIKNLLYDKQYTIQGAKKVLVLQRDAIPLETKAFPQEKPIPDKSEIMRIIREKLIQLKKEMDDK